MSTLNYYKKYVKRYKKELLITIIFLSLETFLGLLIFHLLGKIIDKGVKMKDLTYLYRVGGLMLLITALMGIFTIIRNKYSSYISQSFASDLREDIFVKVNSLKLSSVDKIEKASLITRMTSDINQLQSFVHSLMRVFFKGPILAIGSLILSFTISIKLSLIILVSITIVFLMIKFNLKLSYPLFKKIQVAMDRLNLVIGEYLSAISVVKIFNRYDYEEEKFREANENFRDRNIKASKIMAIFTPLATLLINLTLVLIIYLSGLELRDFNLSLGDIVSFINYMGQILFGLLVINRFFYRGLRAKTSSDRILEILAEDSEDIDSGLDLEKIYKIEFKNLYFKYPSTKDYILRDISFSLKSGEELAIIGPTASGKTSLINLILGFYDFDKGEIYINDIPIKNLRKKAIREKVALIDQTTVLFKGSILENLKLAKNNDFSQIKDATSMAMALDFIEGFADGFNTQVGEGGVRLSGGQKQRISIARGLLKNPDILILDDSSSALDLSTERKLLSNIKTLDSMIKIIISQRISTVMQADKIIVLDAGEITGIGSHKDLLKNCSSYREIYKSQIGAEEELEYVKEG